jgi:hypothetical protein
MNAYLVGGGEVLIDDDVLDDLVARIDILEVGDTLPLAVDVRIQIPPLRLTRSETEFA